MASFVRLYLVPINGVQQVIDIDSTVLIKSGSSFVPPQGATSIDLTMAPVTATMTPFAQDAVAQSMTQSGFRNVRICWREPVGSDDFPSNEPVTVPDPTGGECVCGITCAGTEITYIPVLNIA